jgi:Glycosyl transferases group 1
VFLAGGRPVREKGFAELCRDFAGIRDWATERDLRVSLAILCRERQREKGTAYISVLEEIVAENELGDVVSIEPKVSLELLRQRTADASAIIVPSIYDPFSLMATYAMEQHRPAFVSVHAGVSEGIRSREFVFDPQVPGDLLRAIDTWHQSRPDFVFETRFPSYQELYLLEEEPDRGNREFTHR